MTRLKLTKGFAGAVEWIASGTDEEPHGVKVVYPNTVNTEVVDTLGSLIEEVTSLGYNNKGPYNQIAVSDHKNHDYYIAEESIEEYNAKVLELEMNWKSMIQEDLSPAEALNLINIISNTKLPEVEEV